RNLAGGQLLSLPGIFVFDIVKRFTVAVVDAGGLHIDGVRSDSTGQMDRVHRRQLVEIPDPTGDATAYGTHKQQRTEQGKHYEYPCSQESGAALSQAAYGALGAGVAHARVDAHVPVAHHEEWQRSLVERGHALDLRQRQGNEPVGFQVKAGSLQVGVAQVRGAGRPVMALWL